MKNYPLAVPPGLSHSLTDVVSANNSTLPILSGTVSLAKTVIIAKDTTTPMTTAPIPTHSALPNLSVWSLLLTVVPPPNKHVVAQPLHFTCSTTLMTGGTMVRTILMMITIGKLEYD